MTGDIPETVLAQAKAYVRANHGSTAGWSEVIARAIMDERKRCIRWVEDMALQEGSDFGLVEAMWLGEEI